MDAEDAVEEVTLPFPLLKLRELGLAAKEVRYPEGAQGEEVAFVDV